MTMTGIGGMGHFRPTLGAQGHLPFIAFSSAVIDATGEKYAVNGTVWHPGGGSKNITRVQFPFAAVTKAGGSALTISLQDVDLATGLPSRPDGTQDQNVAVANADAGFAVGWYRSGAFSAVRAVLPGDFLAVVWEYDGAGRLGADTVSLSYSVLPSYAMQKPAVTHNTGTWGALVGIPVLVLEYDDGTYGTLFGSTPFSAIGSHTFNTGSTSPGDEIGIRIYSATPLRVAGFYGILQTTGDCQLILYDNAGSAISGGTVTIDKDTQQSAAIRLGMYALAAPLTLSANTVYYLFAKPTSATSIVLNYLDVNTAAFWKLIGETDEWYQAHRTDAGSIATTTTRRPMLGVIADGYDDGASAGGAPLVNGGLVQRII